MNQKCCMFCDQAVAVESADLCSKCFTMAEQISFLIENHSEKVGYFLAEKFMQIAEREKVFAGRRVKQYKPPEGPHTPERRVKIRRTRQVTNSPKRRNTDLTD